MEYQLLDGPLRSVFVWSLQSQPFIFMKNDLCGLKSPFSRWVDPNILGDELR